MEREGEAGERPGRDRTVAGLAGAAACLVFLAAEHLLASSVPFPPAATAQWLVRATPGDIDTYFIDRLHHLALPLAYAATGLGFLAASAALIGLAMRPRSRQSSHFHLAPALAPAVALLPLWAFWVVVSSPDRSALPRVWFALATLPAVAVGGSVAARVGSRSRRWSGGARTPPTAPGPADPSRRRLVGSLSLGALRSSSA